MPIMYNKFLKYYFVFLILLFCIPQTVFSDYIVSENISISATVGPDNTGGGGGGGITVPTTVNFSGLAYPNSKVYLIKDGEIFKSVNALPDSTFKISVSDLVTDTYTFSLYTEDDNGRKSSFFSFPIFLKAETTVNIDNIFLSPTIYVNKTQIIQGQNLSIFGQSIPFKEVVISLNLGSGYAFSVIADALGKYIYNLDTSDLSLGDYLTKSKTISNNLESLHTLPLSFRVGDKNISSNNNLCSSLIADLNCDDRVNLIDFSILAYWYNNPNPISKVDLNNDGIVSFVDFSIMAFYWTN